jgi:hypothetical protein
MNAAVSIVYNEDLEPIKRLTKDLRDASITLNSREARYAVDLYYQMQDNRIRADGQIRSMKDEPHATLQFFAGQAEALESQIKRALDAYSFSSAVGVWSRGICGIGPVIAAGLMANIDITRTPTAGGIWRYAGYDSSVRWASKDKCEDWIEENLGTKLDNDSVITAANFWGRRGDSLLRMATMDHKTGKLKKLTVKTLGATLARRPWNASLKTLCWKLGESFVKVKGRDSDVYGKIYDIRKVYEHSLNAEGGYAEDCERILKEKNWSNDTIARKAYMAGRLPDGHIHARAKRYAVKLFLAHWHQVAYENAFNKAAPLPYSIAILNHAHQIPVPNYVSRFS